MLEWLAPAGAGSLAGFAGLGRLPARFWLIALPSSIGAGIAMGVPTAIIPNPVFMRMIPAGPLNYAFWAVTSVLLGLIIATYLTGDRVSVNGENQAAGGGILSVFAVGCPICNKLVVLTLGMSGALTYFAPLQPLIGLASIALLAYALRLRLQRMEGICRI